MRFEGKVSIKAPREEVYRFLVDPRKLSQCIPDIQDLQIIDERSFKATVKVGISFIKGTYKFEASFVELNPPSHGRMRAKGSAPGAGVNIETSMSLFEEGNGYTRMEWEADAKVSGILASVGARFLKGAAEKIINQFFECIKLRLEESK